MIGAVEPQACEHMRGDLGAFLRRLRSQRVQAAELRRQTRERPQLPVHHRDPAIGPVRPRAAVRIGINRLPHARHHAGTVLHQQRMQEGGAGARQAGDEDRRHDRLRGDRRHLHFRLLHPQQVGQKADNVPPRGDAPDQAEVRLGDAAVQKAPQRLDELDVAERRQAGGALRLRDQFAGRQRPPQQPQGIRRRHQRPRARPPAPSWPASISRILRPGIRQGRCDGQAHVRSRSGPLVNDRIECFICGQPGKPNSNRLLCNLTARLK